MITELRTRCTTMRYVAAALLVNMAGNELTRANIQRILESVGVECEDDKLQIVLDQLKGKVTRPHFLNLLQSLNLVMDSRI
jgi:hypothetical protein